MSENRKQDRLIRLSTNPTDEQLIDGIRQWLELLANDDYERAIQAIVFDFGTPTPDGFHSRIETFFGEEFRSKADTPNQDVLQRTEIYRTGIPDDCEAVIGFFIPLINGYGIWTTFFLRLENNSTFFEFEIFHL
jgi:hypothetical protein